LHAVGEPASDGRTYGAGTEHVVGDCKTRAQVVATMLLPVTVEELYDFETKVRVSYRDTRTAALPQNDLGELNSEEATPILRKAA